AEPDRGRQLITTRRNSLDAAVDRAGEFILSGVAVFGGDLRLRGRGRAGAHPAVAKQLVQRPIPPKRRVAIRCASIAAATDLIKVSKGELMNTQIHSNAQEHEMAIEVELSVEELEEIISPGVELNHNETLVSDGEA